MGAVTAYWCSMTKAGWCMVVSAAEAAAEAAARAPLLAMSVTPRDQRPAALTTMSAG